MARLFLLLSCLTTFGIAFGYPRLHIVEGEEVSPHKYPWIVALETKKWSNGTHSVVGQCGGALLALNDDANSSDIVLTAAHCVVKCKIEMKLPTDDCESSNRKIDANKVTIIAGNHFQTKEDEGEKKVAPSRLEIHPAWAPPRIGISPVGDIAVIKLSEKIKFTQTIQPAYLPKSGESVKEAKNCVLAGWGYTTAANQQDEEQTEVLYAVNISKIYDEEKCGEKWPQIPLDKRDIVFCAEAKSRVATACSGDSGSPLSCFSNENRARPVVFGVVSAGPEICGDSAPSVFGTVPAYVEWIKDTIELMNRDE